MLRLTFVSWNLISCFALPPHTHSSHCPSPSISHITFLPLNSFFFLFTTKVLSLNLDNCKSGGSLAGVTHDFSTMESLSSLSINHIELKSLFSFPSLPRLRTLKLADNRIAIGKCCEKQKNKKTKYGDI